MNNNKNGSTTNNKHKAKKIIKLIIYIILLGLLAFISVKSCNITLKALTPTVLSWDDLSNVDIMCNVNGGLIGTLDPDTYYYMNNGNDEYGYTNTPAFSIYDTYTGLQYDEIRIRRNSIILRGYLYDSLDNFSDYYDRQIWADDFISEEITPDTIRFENITQTKVDNIAIFSLNFGQNGPTEFLELINDNFSYTFDNETLINTIYLDSAQGNYIDLYLLSGPDAFVGLKVYIYKSWNDSETTNIYYFDERISYSIINLNNLENNLNNYVEVVASYNDITSYCDIYVNIAYENFDNYSSFDFYFEPDGDPISYISYYIYNYIQMTEYYKNATADNAYIVGYSDGNTSGREVGYNIGYQDGYDDGASGEINTNWVLSLMNTATSILNIEILPNIKLIYLVGAFIILGFVRFVIGWIR